MALYSPLPSVGAAPRRDWASLIARNPHTPSERRPGIIWAGIQWVAGIGRALNGEAVNGQAVNGQALNGKKEEGRQDGVEKTLATLIR